MPFARISLQRGKSAAYLRTLADQLHRALVEAFEVPPDDRFQIIHQHEPGELAALVGFDPTAWTQVRFQLWGAAHPPVPGPGVAAYTIGHVSTAAA